jgi:hypothetical protein
MVVKQAKSILSEKKDLLKCTLLSQDFRLGRVCSARTFAPLARLDDIFKTIKSWNENGAGHGCQAGLRLYYRSDPPGL